MNEQKTVTGRFLLTSGVENVRICVPCREKHYADNHLSVENYVPTKSHFQKHPHISYLDRFISNLDSGTIWKTREKFGIQPSDEISQGYRRKFATDLSR